MAHWQIGAVRRGVSKLGDVRVDSFRFLPRSFRAMFESPEPLAGETDSVWAPFDVRLADAKIALLSSAGFSVRGEQEPFDAETERQQPFWGDPSWRAISREMGADQLEVTHLHINPVDLVQDPEIALPARALDTLVADGIVGATTSTHFSVMGYQRAGLEEWRSTAGPEIVARLRDEGADGVVLAPA
jgi:Glycine/sarcosine/betaine reductase selenoprotein B (GRDB)